MTTATTNPLVEDYLERLDRAGRDLPRRRRAELVAEIDAHLAEALGPDPTDADVLTALDRLGEPEDIIAAEEPTLDAATEGPGLHEWAAVFLLLFGGFLAGIGWFVGLALLLTSRAWTTNEKLLGALVIPGGLVGPFVLFMGALLGTGQACSSVNGGPETCTGSSFGGGGALLALVLLAALAVAPIATAVYLARRAR